MSDLVGNPNCWFSHAQAQITMILHKNKTEKQKHIKSQTLSICVPLYHIYHIVPELNLMTNYGNHILSRCHFRSFMPMVVDHMRVKLQHGGCCQLKLYLCIT